MKTKRFIAFFLSILLVAMCAVNASAATNFNDVSANAWYAESVQFVSDNGLMVGIGDRRFDPDGKISRGMLVTILYRMEGAPAVSVGKSFKDVKRGAYYESAVIWASENNIVYGYSTKKFGPDDDITREQLAAMLYRYRDYKHGDVTANGDLRRFQDAEKVSSYALNAMLWANTKGLIIGTNTTMLSPKDTATRAQAATIIMRYVKNIATDEEDVFVTEEDDTPDVPKPEEPDTTEPPFEVYQTTLAVISSFAKPGERVSVDVNMLNNPGILGMTLTVSYDEQNLKLIEANNGEAFDDVLTFVPSRSLKSGSNFVWYGTDLYPEQIRDGNILTLTFEVSGHAEGSIPIFLTAVDGDVVDVELHAVNVILQNGNIIIN